MSSEEAAALEAFETQEVNGRPLGSEAFLAEAERKLGRTLRKQKPGPRPRTMEPG